jgi:rhodanese-related sulfurtransferase
MIKTFTPVQAVKVLKDDKVRLIDVRENWEYNIARIEGSELMPLSNFNQHLKFLKKDDRLIIYCHHGIRNASVCNYLVDSGYTDVANLEGGIDAWSHDVDPSVPIY